MYLFIYILSILLVFALVNENAVEVCHFSCALLYDDIRIDVKQIGLNMRN